MASYSTPPRTTNPFGIHHRADDEREDWEDWEDDEIVTPIVDDDQSPINVADSPTVPRISVHPPPAKRTSQARQSVQRIKRLKSRQRQKAQNARAGIRLVTDMSALRRQQATVWTPDARPPKFVDAAALQALEGEPNSASVGNWNWMRRNKSQGRVGRSPTGQDLSPNDRPIVIGIAMPEDDLANRSISPHTAVIETPVGYPAFPGMTTAKPTKTKLVHPQQPSVWSPDTPSTATTVASLSPSRASSIYSQYTVNSGTLDPNVPPVPAVPANFKQDQKLISIELRGDSKHDDSDDDACTLFEEDGTLSPIKATKAKTAALTPDSAAPSSAGGQSRGWWDTVTTPFNDKFDQTQTAPTQTSPKQTSEKLISPLATPRVASPKTVPTKPTSPAPRSPDLVSPTFVSSKLVAPQLMSSRIDSPRLVNTRPSTPKLTPGRQETTAAAAPAPTPATVPAHAAAPSMAPPKSTASPAPRAAPTFTPAPAAATAANWWENADEKRRVPSPKPSLPASPRPQRVAQTPPPPIVRAPTPRRTPSPYLDRPSSSSASSSRSVPERTQTPVGPSRTQVTPAATPGEAPPPYSPPKNNQNNQSAQSNRNNQSSQSSQAQTPVRYRPVFPPGHPLTAQYPPSPGPISPGISGTMTSQGGISMTNIPLTPGPRTNTMSHSSSLAQLQLPTPPASTYLPGDHFHAAPTGPAGRAERARRRHEKEEIMARKVGGLWRGRGCIPAAGCFGRSGREGRKRRRVWLGIIGGLIAVLILIIVLAVTLTRPGGSADPIDSLFLNLTNFPPMPTGVVTVVAPDNSAAVSGCTQPTTMWSCALPKEKHEDVAPFNPNQPTFIFQIQWDNSTRELWNVPNGTPPNPGAQAKKRDAEEELVERATDAVNGGSVVAQAAAVIRERQAQDGGFKPSPDPPSFREMFFLGNTTDGIVSADKAGEPTPFYISVLPSLNVTVANALDKRQQNGGNNRTVINLPAPELNADGTGAPARLFPNPVQQPIRLYDRGLPTEHYGFYTYFRRTIYLKSVTVLNNTRTGDNVPVDEDGGSRETEAKFLVSWEQTRFLVQIWTRSENTTKLLRQSDGQAANEGPTTIRPGTMPYPVTIKLDTHGGVPGEKVAWLYPVDDRQRIVTSGGKLIANDIGFGGELINPRSRGDAAFGGFDGGSGGCRCEWVNFLARRPDRNES